MINLQDAAASKAVSGIIAREDLTLEQKYAAATSEIAKPGISSAKKAELQKLINDGLGSKVASKASLTELKSAAVEAARIAKESGNQFGLLLATVTNGVIDTLLAKVDDTIKSKAFSGDVNAIASAATAVGLTFAQFVQLIGRGDLAASRTYTNIST